ncbi:hypothetical protein Bca4012_088867 [Brassica carinata]|uniref:Uncharacterized protein n=3 Tax=Brassica TaxID=3705 RepID=A0A0D3A8G4_BRAOL|nr:unnamed protein product [Brassica napus]CDY26526.1 BnaC01g23730D [Brassica napus]VDD50503.1 unnamed protein product [Brassica oleracea]
MSNYELKFRFTSGLEKTAHVTYNEGINVKRKKCKRERLMISEGSRLEVYMEHKKLLEKLRKRFVSLMLISMLKLELTCVCTFTQNVPQDTKARVLSDSYPLGHNNSVSQVAGTKNNIEVSCATFSSRALDLEEPLKTTHQIDNCTEGWYFPF